MSSVLNLDYPSVPGLSADELKREAADILDAAADIGYTAVFLQVRPTADALYASEIFPWSDWLSEAPGQAPAGGFDPLSFWVEEAHARGMELHAWINPFRITKGTPDAPLHDPEALPESHPARLNPSWTVNYPDGNMYFNPGLPEVRRLVIDGVSELVRRYDVDGVHFDDYFYPGLDFGDEEAFETYGAGFSDINDWRRDCVNRLIRDTAAAVKGARAGCRFGVSPTGVWANKSSNPLGSATRGYEGYYSSCADSRLWVKSGWVDYICPQLYWHIGHERAGYETLLLWWADVVGDTPVDLYIGQAVYRVGEGEAPSDAWYDESEITRQMALNDTIPEVAGVVHFRYGSLAGNPALYAAVKEAFAPGPPGSLATLSSAS